MAKVNAFLNDRTMLIVDDDEDKSLAWARHFKQLGYEVRTSQSLANAMAQHRAKEIDVTLFKFELVGLSLIKYCRQHDMGWHFIAIDGNTYQTMEVIQEALNIYEVSGWHKTPVDLSELTKQVARCYEVRMPFNLHGKSC